MEKRSISVDIARMDTQHERLIELVEAVGKALTNGYTLNELKGELDRLLELIGAHFVDEERLLSLFGLDRMESHRRTHSLLLDRLTKLRKNVLDDFGKEGKEKLLAFLETDMYYHIIEDMQAWEQEKVSKKFASQRLHEHESNRGIV